MSKMGGYQILDLGGVELSDSAVTINGAYETIKNSNGKAILVSGANFSGTKVADTFACAIPGTNKYSFLICGYQFEVASNDEVKSVPVDTNLIGVPTMSGYNKFGIPKVLNDASVIGGQTIRVITSGANKGAITTAVLEKINPIAESASLATVISTVNTLLLDLKAKTFMKSN